VSEENKKPAYDEQTLAKLLEAAYVLQEHSDELRALEAQLSLRRAQEHRSGDIPDSSLPEQNPATQKPSAADNEKSSPMAGIVTDARSRNPEFLDATAELAALVAQLSQPEPREQQEFPTSPRCYKCGHELVAGEQFCGECGAARSADAEPASMQSKFASLWHMKSLSGMEEDGKEDQLSDPAAVAAEVPINLRALQQSIATTPDATPESSHNLESVTDLQPTENASDIAGNNGSASAPDWSSPVSTQDHLQAVDEGTRHTWPVAFWNEHRGDIYLVVAVLVVLVAVRFGLWTNRPVSAKSKSANATSSVHKPPAHELPIFERILIDLGLAEPPPPPEDKGNPSTSVWVDLQTGLYYCPNADSYGKTPRGKYASQRDAQLDQFAPAYRKVCD
jgi:hypothetical protein